MITLSAKIFLNGQEGDTEIASLSIDKYNNITDSSSVESIMNDSREVERVFQLGISPMLEDNPYTLRSKYNTYISSLVSSTTVASSGEYEFENGDYCTIQISSKDESPIDCLYINFDEVNEVFPTKVLVNGSVVYCDNSLLKIYFDKEESVTSVNIVVKGLNKPNKGLVICGIYNLIVKDYEGSIESFSFPIRSISETNDISYGVISSSGSISFYDKDKELLSYANRGFIRYGQDISVYLINTLTKKKQQIIKCAVSELQYDNLTFSFEISLVDKLTISQNVDLYAYNDYSSPPKLPDVVQFVSAPDLADPPHQPDYSAVAFYYMFLKDKINSKNGISHIEEDDSELIALLNKIDVSRSLAPPKGIISGLLPSINVFLYSMLPLDTSIWEAIDDFCKSFIFRAYTNRNGNTIIKRERWNV